MSRCYRALLPHLLAVRVVADVRCHKQVVVREAEEGCNNVAAVAGVADGRDGKQEDDAAVTTVRVAVRQ